MEEVKKNILNKIYNFEKLKTKYNGYYYNQNGAIKR